MMILSSNLRYDDFEQVLIQSVKLGCSDVHITSEQPILGRLHGKLSKLAERVITATEVNHLISSIHCPEAKAYLSQMESLNFSHQITLSRQDYLRFRVNASKCQHGTMLVFRHIPGKPANISDLNVESSILTALNKVVGLVVVVGATGSGKSTLLSALVRHKLEQTDESNHIITIEEPIEFLYDSVTNSPHSRISQREVKRDTPSFLQGAIDSRRQDPDVILIGESRDYETISESISCSETGHMVLTTVHANDVAQTISRMTNCYPVDQQQQACHKLISNLELIVAQRLIPTKSGQRQAIREILPFTDEIRESLHNSPNLTQSLKRTLGTHGKPFQHDLAKLLQAGHITEKSYRQYGGSK